MNAALATDLRDYAVRRWPSMNHEWRKARLANILGMRLRRLRSYWDAEETMSPRLDEVEAIEALIGQCRSSQRRRDRSYRSPHREEGGRA